MSKRSVTHATFTIERSLAASPARVFAAFASLEAKQKWFAGPEEWSTPRWDMDFRPGGREVRSAGPKDGPMHSFEAVYWDIVPDQRIIYSFDLHLDELRISASLATIELRPEGKGTRLVFTEQAAFLDGYDDAGSRERGTGLLLDALEAGL
jgi:uncharacterized protein YndB with AHSA1/START domain